MKFSPIFPFGPVQQFASFLVLSIFLFASCENGTIRNAQYTPSSTDVYNPDMGYKDFQPQKDDMVLSRRSYQDKLYGFWLGQCIANWTGLITEMDKIGGAGKDGRGAGFYTREHWGTPDQPNLWNSSDLADTIDFFFVKEGGIWGADDDTDIEYIYQFLLYNNKNSMLTGAQIREGWLQHIKKEEENFLWL